KAPPDGNQQTPKGNVIGHPWKADRPEKNCVVPPDLLQAIFRHHPAVLGVVGAAPGECLPVELDALLSPRPLEHPHPLGHHLFAKPIARNTRDLVLLQVCIPHLCTVRCSMLRKQRFSTASPIRMTVNNPPNTFAVSRRFLFSKMYQPKPPEPWLTPKTSSAAISVLQAKAQPIFSRVRMLGRAAGIRISDTKRGPDKP